MAERLFGIVFAIFTIIFSGIAIVDLILWKFDRGGGLQVIETTFLFVVSAGCFAFVITRSD